MKKVKKIDLPQAMHILAETDKELARMQVNGPSLRWAIDDFHNESIRRRLKYTPDLHDREYQLLIKIEAELWEHVAEFMSR